MTACSRLEFIRQTVVQINLVLYRGLQSSKLVFITTCALNLPIVSILRLVTLEALLRDMVTSRSVGASVLLEVLRVAEEVACLVHNLLRSLDCRFSVKSVGDVLLGSHLGDDVTMDSNLTLHPWAKHVRSLVNGLYSIIGVASRKRRMSLVNIRKSVMVTHKDVLGLIYIKPSNFRTSL
mmetsp:Transcript_41836/g.63982  ORF Transcript_41836/g.63982 Transcript_41836/m.63982 type:complete len:179 (+) Transcript_41836:1237-1773(+)